MSRYPDTQKTVSISNDGENWTELEGVVGFGVSGKGEGSEGWQQLLKDSWGWKESLDSIIEFNERAGTECKYRSIEDDSIGFQKMLIDEECDELNDAFQDGDRKEVVDAACDIIVVATGLLHKLGYDPVKAMSIVNKSNLSKFVDTSNGDEIRKSIEKYDNDDRYVDVSVDLSNGAVWGKVVATGGRKILKSINYQEPQWQELDEDLV